MSPTSSVGTPAGSRRCPGFAGTRKPQRICREATPLGSVTDTVAPSTPTGLTATPASATQVNLSWTASTDNIGVTGYQIFRGGTLLTTVTTTSYSNTGLTPNTAYQYQVRAVDAAGNQSGLSTAAAATTPADTTAPSTPTGLTATAVSTTQVNLSWAASTDNVGVAGYQIFRDGTLLTTVTTTSYSNTGLTPNTTYQYRVGAVDAAGNQSGLSTAPSAATPGLDAIAPSVTLTAPVVPVGSNSVTVAGCQRPRDRMQRSRPGKSARRDRLGVGKQLVGNQRIGLRRPRPGSLSLPVSRSGASERLGRTSPAALSPPLT